MHSEDHYDFRFDIEAQEFKKKSLPRYNKCQIEFGDYVQEGTLLNNYAHVFDLIMRMRQAVDHPYLVTHGMATRGIIIPSKSNKRADQGTLKPLRSEMISD
jgi:SNF2 family DNA or RNA helicase